VATALWWWVLAAGGILILLEVGLRVKYGLGNPPLYVVDARTGYRLAPNQRLRRRGNRIETNQYSMRGGAIQPQPQPDTLRILLLGDSIVNGGWWTDQPDTLSQVMQAALANGSELPFSQFEVLNASANSWGPRNELGYVLKFGTFESQLVLMVLNTDDLFAIAPNSLELQRSPAYPTRRPLLALLEGLARLRKRPPSAELKALHDQQGDRVGANLEAIRQLQHITDGAKSHLLVAMTPLRRELGEDGPRDYELRARQRVEEFLQHQGIPYLDFLPRFRQTDYASLYRDHIHLSPQGNDLVGQQLADFVAKTWSLPTEHPPQLPVDDVLQDLWQEAME
jgi:hypothetical protein